MKDPNQSLIEVAHHIILAHPEARQSIEHLIFKDKSLNPLDANFLLTVFAPLLQKSKSQFKQDLFVLSQLNFKRDGFFVEFGGMNGVDLSNSYLLETEYNWKGIVAEPATCWHEALDRNRACFIEKKCVWSQSNSTLVFNETKFPELATINDFSKSDSHGESRADGKLYEVSTISLNDLLQKYNAPKEIDYLSIDTEGSEYEILSNFDFLKYSFKVITCEHNYTPMRQKIFDLLTANGYIRVFDSVSMVDDWYIKPTAAN